MKYESLLKKSRPYLTIKRDKEHDMLNHCYMIIGEDSLAVNTICRLIARMILCNEDGCGTCITCKKVEDHNHTAVREIQQDKIKVKDIEELIESTFLMSSDGDTKIYIIHNCENMLPDAQNKLLKTLEEPNENVIFILGCTRFDAVLTTIKSRAKKLFVERFKKEDLKEELIKIDTDFEKVKTATVCSFGSLTRAVALLNDEGFKIKVEKAIEALTVLKSSRDILKAERCLEVASGEQIKEYLEIFEIIIKILIERDAVSGGYFEGVATLFKGYSIRAAVNIQLLLANARAQIESNCQLNAIQDRLFLGITEVKYKCR